MEKEVKKTTPLMKQYNSIKAKYPDALLLFRVGDFYETFGNDAINASKILDIVLTKRGAGSQSETELAGFPFHSLNLYLPKLVKAGICLLRDSVLWADSAACAGKAGEMRRVDAHASGTAIVALAFVAKPKRICGFTSST